MSTNTTGPRTRRAASPAISMRLLPGMAGALILLHASAAYGQIWKWTVYNTANSGIPADRVTGVAIDPQGNVWTGHSSTSSMGSGCAKFDGQNWTVYNTSNSGLPHNNVMAFAFDPQGNVWIGTGSPHGTGAGLARFDGSSWTVYSMRNSPLPSANIWCLKFGPQGALWIGTVGGLAKFDGEEWTTYTTGNSALPHNYVANLAFDSQANLWVATWGGGVGRFDGENWTVYNKANSGLPGNKIVGLGVDPQDNIWLGDYEGLNGNDGGLGRFDGANWTIYNTENSGLTANGIWALTIDGYGNVWAGPISEQPPVFGGLVKYDGKNWTVYNTSNSRLPHDNVKTLAVDDRGTVCVGTEHGGLAVLRSLPKVDFDEDGVVDIDDLLLLIESWGTSDSLTDIAPLPYGDGFVDEQDLEMLMDYWGQEAYDSTLIAHWKLDEVDGTAAADSVSGNDGLLIGDPIWRPEGGVVDGTLEFDGTDDVVTTDFVVDPEAGPFSAIAWVQTGAPGQVIISQDSGSEWLAIDAESGGLMTAVAPPPARKPVGPLVSNAVVTDGLWHRIALVWDGTSRSLYVDGTLAATDEQSSLVSCTGGLNIGCGSDQSPDTFFSGLIDDVRIYNRAVRP